MSIYILALVLLCLWGISFKGKNGFDDYMSPQKTGSIKGVFVIIVLLSHIRQYVTLDNAPLHGPFKDVMGFLGQLMVVMFLFYSGYGVFLSLQKKPGYVKSILTQRAPKVLIHYDMAIVLFFLLGLCLDKGYTVKRMLLSFIGLDALGNSVWFIFVTLILYIVTFVSFAFTGKKLVLSLGITTVLSVVAVFLLKYFKGNDYWWYDTVMCYPLGMWYAYLKPRIDKLLLNDFNKWFSATAVSGVIFVSLYELYTLMHRSRLIFIVMALFFAITLVLASMRITIDNPVLRWFGKRVFGVYILQRIPMIILAKYGINADPIIFTAISIAVTVVIAEVFERAMDKLDVVLRLSKKRS